MVNDEKSESTEKEATPPPSAIHTEDKPQNNTDSATPRVTEAKPTATPSKTSDSSMFEPISPTPFPTDETNNAFESVISKKAAENNDKSDNDGFEMGKDYAVVEKVMNGT